MLRLEIPVEPNEQHQNAYPNEGCTKWLAQMPQLVNVVGVCVDGDV
jgi:hypothetical protein